MAPLGNFIRLIPLQLDELPSHPLLETRFHNSFSIADRTTRTQARDNLHSSNDVSQHQSDAQGNDSLGPKDGYNAPTEDPNPSNNNPGIIQDGLHHPEDRGSLRSGIFDDTGRPNLIPFIKAILDEATNFVDITMPRTFFEGGLKSSSPSTAKVRLSRRTFTGTELSQVPWEKSTVPRKAPPGIMKSSEAWFARNSTHANRDLKGTASYSEFDFALRVDHSQHEREYTPDVFDDFKVLEWDLGSTPYELVIDKYRHITMGIYEMCHKLPFPMAPRVFPVLVTTAQTGAAEFVVVQIPVNLESLPEAFYSNGRNLKEGRSALQMKKPVLGIYTSIERCLMDEHPDISSKNEITWIMATASDARGWLPMWMQKLGVPGVVVKDVGLVVKWLQGRREETAA